MNYTSKYAEDEMNKAVNPKAKIPKPQPMSAGQKKYNIKKKKEDLKNMSPNNPKY